MRRFLSSAWFPVLTALVLAGVTVAAFAALQPSGSDVGNSQILKAAKIAGWAIGPVAALLSLIGAGIINLIRRLVRLRKLAVLDPVVVLASIVPWAVLAWSLTGEPRYTPIARAIIDFVGRPLLWGSMAACLLTICLGLGVFIPAKKK